MMCVLKLCFTAAYIHTTANIAHTLFISQHGLPNLFLYMCIWAGMHPCTCKHVHRICLGYEGIIFW